MVSERCGGRLHIAERKEPKSNMIFLHELIREDIEGFCVVNSEPTHEHAHAFCWELHNKFEICILFQIRSPLTH